MEMPSERVRAGRKIWEGEDHECWMDSADEDAAVQESTLLAWLDAHRSRGAHARHYKAVLYAA